MSSPARPGLRFETVDAMVADVDRLRGGYERAGQWDLPTMLDHITREMSGPFEGDQTKLPWPIAAPVRAGLHLMVWWGRYPTVSLPMMPSLRPTRGLTIDATYDHFRATAVKMAALPGGPVDWPPIGRVSRSDFVGLQLLHAAHHLAFLRPTPP